MESQKVEKLELKLKEITKHQQTMFKQINQIVLIQSDIAKQVIDQHEQTDAILIGLGLKKDLSYYSFDMMNAEEH